MSGTWIYKHTAESDAEPFLNWRSFISDEEWMDWNAQEDKDWYNAVDSTYGLNCREKQL